MLHPVRTDQVVWFTPPNQRGDKPTRFALRPLAKSVFFAVVEHMQSLGDDADMPPGLVMDVVRHALAGVQNFGDGPEAITEIGPREDVAACFGHTVPMVAAEIVEAMPYRTATVPCFLEVLSECQVSDADRKNS